MNSVKYNWGRSVALLLIGLVLVQARVPLRLNSDGSFKIMFITDLHIGESESNDLKTQGTIQAVLELEKPNFVVLGGDTFSNYAKTAPNPKPARWVQTQWLKAVQPLMGKAEWAVVLGNHDQGTEMNANDISKFDSDLEGSHTMADDSMGDYALPILDSNGQEIVTRLFMFNSQSAGLEPWQVDRYLRRSEVLEKTLGRTVPSMAFMHIPLREVYDLYNDGAFRGKMRDRDGVCYQATDLFSALQSRGEVKVITFGHDHGNDFVGNWKGIQLAYGKKTGESAYNELLEGQVLASKGARIFKIQIRPPGGTLAPALGSLLYSETRRDEKSGNELYNLSIHSWIRTADGEIDEQKELATRAYSRLHKNCTGPIDPLVWFGVVVGVLVLISCILIVISRWRNCRLKSKTSANFVLLTSDNEEAHDLQKLA